MTTNLDPFIEIPGWGRIRQSEINPGGRPALPNREAQAFDEACKRADLPKLRLLDAVRRRNHFTELYCPEDPIEVEETLP